MTTRTRAGGYIIRSCAHKLHGTRTHEVGGRQGNLRASWVIRGEIRVKVNRRAGYKSISLTRGRDSQVGVHL